MPRRRRLGACRRDDVPDDDDADGDDSCCREKPQQRNAANARERARMRVLSRAFCRLKTTLPWVPADTKLSKLDTLRLATSYIAHLRAVLTDDVNAPVHPLNLTWPFSFQHASQQRPDDWSTSSDAHGQHHADSSSSCPDGDLDDDSVPTQMHPHHFHQHQHFSDSLLHLG